MVTLDVRPEIAERLAEMADERGIDVDSLLVTLLDEEEGADDAADLEAARVAEAEWEAAGRPIVTTEHLRAKHGL